MPLNEIEDAESKKTVVKHEEVIVPIYKFKDVEKEINVFKEIEIEGVAKKDFFDFVGKIKSDLKELSEIVHSLVKYQIKEKEVISQVVKLEDFKVKNPVFEDVTVKNPVFEDVKVANPVFYEKPIAEISQKDLDLLIEYKKSLAGVYEMLQKIRTYKIQEDVIRREQQIFIPKKVEVPSEKVVVTVKDEVIETLEELLEHVKKNKAGE